MAFKNKRCLSKTWASPIIETLRHSRETEDKYSVFVFSPTAFRRSTTVLIDVYPHFKTNGNFFSFAAHKNLGFDRTKESVASATFESMHPSSPRKKCCSSPSSLSSHAGRCSSECLGQVSLNNMSPSSSSGRPSWRTIYLTMLVIFLAFSLQTAGKNRHWLEMPCMCVVARFLTTVVSFCHWTFECLFGYLSPESSHVVRRRPAVSASATNRRRFFHPTNFLST